MAPKIWIRSDREGPTHRFHPWVFSGAVQRIEQDLQEGDIVEIVSSSNKRLAWAHYASGSILAKIFSFKAAVEEPLDEISRLLKEAFNLRKSLGLISNSKTSCFRLINAEGDSLPGLIVDVYDKVLVLQFHSKGMYRLQKFIAEKILELFAGDLTCIYSKCSKTMGVVEDEVLHGQSEIESIVKEDNLKFLVNYQEGQKTGFFIDQRDSRKLIQNLAAGRRVLNAFSYSGGFSVGALAGGAKLVQSLDISESALELCRKNVDLNFKNAAHETRLANYFDADLSDDYDLIVLDPPALAKSIQKKNEAIKAYQAVNYKAFARIASSSWLLTFSCSQVVSTDEFFDAVMYAAYKSGRQVKVVKELSAAACHPRSLYHREGKYLKGLLLSVD